MEKLDKNLLDHAAKLADGNGPQIVDVYQLQGLAEVHCYLKTAHQFDPAEVDALLQFADPLEAARYCWDINTVSRSATCCGKPGRGKSLNWQSRNRRQNCPCVSSYVPP